MMYGYGREARSQVSLELVPLGGCGGMLPQKILTN